MSNIVASVTEFVLFAVTAALATAHKTCGYDSAGGASKSCASEPGIVGNDASSCFAKTSTSTSPVLRNSAFVFVKPHANTAATQNLVRNKLIESGCSILFETDIDAKTIDEKKLIDQHYYAIASKATILPAKDIPVPKDKFLESFGESWDVVLSEGRAVNALMACEAFGCDSATLNDAWQKSKAIKFGGGFYCALVTVGSKSLYVFNAFFMTMRSKFVEPGVSIHCYEIEFDASQLSWSDFRNVVLGPTDPAAGPVGSLRRTILDQYSELGLKSIPDKGDNGVHASASPFEGLAEKTNWLGRSIEADPFGKALLDAGLALETIKAWSVDPQIVVSKSETGEITKGSIFDALEDTDAADCLTKLVELNKIN